MSSPIRLLYGFFCESLRQEVSGQTTAIGLWGGTLKLKMPGPIVLPSVAFHAHISNPEHIPLKGLLTFSVPGNPQPIMLPIDIPPAPDITGTNINFGINGITIQDNGEIAAIVEIEAEPPIKKTFILKIELLHSSNDSFNIMIKCPKTGVAIRTGMATNKASFDSTNFINNCVKCPVCGEIHTWNKVDAFLG